MLRLLYVLKWICMSVVLLVVMLNVTIYAINRRDRPASPNALAFAALLDTAPVADQDNGYVHFMGIAAAEGADPLAEGRRDIARIEDAARSNAFATLKLDGRAYARLRTPAVAALQDKCMGQAVACADALSANPALVSAWLGPEQWLLARYQAMLTRTAWQETPATLGALAPAISTSAAFDGQELLFLKVWTCAGDNDAQAVRTLLQSDLQFWRTVLASSDRLITKMIAIAALTRHFSWANLALKRLPAERQAAAIPPGWRTSLTLEERSLRKAWAGELEFLRSNLQEAMTVRHEEWQQRVSSALFYRTVQIQASINDRADFFSDLSRLFDGDYATLASAAGQGRHLEQRSLYSVLGKGLYNIGGNVLESVGMPNFTNYAARAADLEGIRRAHLLMADLRAAGTRAPAMAASIAAATVRAPYTGKPLRWSEQEQAIIAEGLAPGQRARHAVPL